MNPVSIRRSDAEGRLVQTISATASGVTTLAGLASYSFAQSSYTAWTVHHYNTAGQLDYTRVYYSVPSVGEGTGGTNYNETTFGYDVMGRRDTVTTPGGTITQTVFDVRNNPIEVYVGTSENNMTLVTESAYEGSGGSCGCSGGIDGGR